LPVGAGCGLVDQAAAIKIERLCGQDIVVIT
jgi:hypothetical protein